jgi:hypothetical protein
MIKNVHVLPTDKPSRLIIYSTLLNEFRLLDEPIEDWKHKRHIYITNDEEIKEGDFVTNGKYVSQAINEWWTKFYIGNPELKADYWKIILTTDQDLIKQGVQSIDDEFLEWFVKNPTCEYVKVKNSILKIPNRYDDDYRAIPYFKIKIPKDLGYTTKSGIEVSDKMVRATMIPKEYFGREEDEMMEVPMPISKEPKKEYTEQDMLLAAKYGYNFHKTTSFPDQEFEDSCVRNTQQWLTTLK